MIKDLKRYARLAMLHDGGEEEEEEEEEEERDLIEDLKRHVRLAVVWDRHGSPVPRWTLTRVRITRPDPTLAPSKMMYKMHKRQEITTCLHVRPGRLTILECRFNKTTHHHEGSLLEIR